MPQEDNQTLLQPVDKRADYPTMVIQRNTTTSITKYQESFWPKEHKLEKLANPAVVVTRPNYIHLFRGDANNF